MAKNVFTLLLSVMCATTLFAGGGAEQAEPDAADNRVVVALSPTTGESHRFWTVFNWEMLNPALEPLVGHNPATGEFITSRLAESWEPSDDLLQWTFRLKEGVQFHHGWGEVTSADVVHSFQLHTAPDSAVPGAEQLRNATAVALDPYTVRFDLESPDPNFLFLHGGRTTMYIYSKAQFDAEGLAGYDEQLVGTGHYRFVERSPGRILYERVEDHYSGVTPDFEELEIRYVAEASTRLAMLQTGEADIAQVPIELHPEAVSSGMELIESTGPTMQTDIAFNGLYLESGDPAGRPELPWADVRVREAINRALNRDEMIDVLFDGRAELNHVHAMKIGHEGFDPTLIERFPDQYGYEPERARQLLDEAGYPERFPDPTIPLILTQLPGQPEVPLQMEMVQQYLTAVGLQAEIRQIDHATIGTMGRAREAYFLNPNRNAPVRPTETGLRAFYTNPGGPYEGFESDEIGAMVAELIRTRDLDERDQIAREAFNYLFDNYAAVPLFEVKSIVAVNPATVADWTFPGVTSAGISHWHLIRAAQ